VVGGYVVSNNSQHRDCYEDQDGFPRHFHDPSACDDKGSRYLFALVNGRNARTSRSRMLLIGGARGRRNGQELAQTMRYLLMGTRKRYQTVIQFGVPAGGVLSLQGRMVCALAPVRFGAFHR
jgi:hypothetical protein